MGPNSVDGPSEGGVSAAETILLVSPDLMVTSRLAGLARELPARIETLRSLDAPRTDRAACRLAIVDLGGLQGDPAVVIAKVRAIVGPSSDTVVAAFGPHVARERLDNARLAGADHVVSRGELLGGFAALVRRWCAASG